MDSIITVENVSMHFRMDKNHTTSLKEWVVSFLKGKQQYEEFHALENVTFDVKRGEIFGVIGRNGAGKSTLLKVVSGIYKPTSGKAVSAGRIAPMLELGSGFDPEMTGRENIILNGSILGYSQEHLEKRIDEIIAFSELGDFIDVPVKTYSSGMTTRLAFAVATAVEPEILIVDEILSVGDEAFQRKSFARMMELMSHGATVLFVSHALAQIRKLCDTVIWIDKGKIRMMGDVDDVCNAYELFMSDDYRNAEKQS